jgi:hypothetical protein
LCWVFSRVSWTICTGWLQNVILLISASWVARLQAWARWIVCKTLSQKTHHQKRLAQGAGPEFKSQHCKKKKKQISNEVWETMGFSEK